MLTSDLVSTIHGITRVGQDLVTKPPAPHNSPWPLQLTTVGLFLVSLSLFFFFFDVPSVSRISAEPFHS